MISRHKRASRVRALAAPRGANGSLAGLTLVEVVAAMVVLAFALASLGLLTARAGQARSADASRRLAEDAVRGLVGEIRAASAVALADPATWGAVIAGSYGPGGNPGSARAVPGLDPVPGAASVLSVQVVTDETLTDQALGVALGMPRDLDGDGLADKVDVTATATLLPVIVRAQWAVGSGSRQLTHAFYLLGYR